ncbi:hypothetical protein N825_25450 [Skermanella stibiiresistens SB22]|uniref:Uncharacterized protein n=1 Tax=Skermanella stibiiresistens SB22 TaxID=1385369 RepID=W9GZ75_9PROT|nr:phage tail protein [Skermanella stibiiresistens]EWY36783.1 hypothetical protein N825_25450 [Skermanella stibiiresistens SB22]
MMDGLSVLDGEILPPETRLPVGQIRVIAAPRPFAADRVEALVPAPATLVECAEAAGIDLRRQHCLIWLGPHQVPQALAHRIRPRTGVTVVFRAVATGGGGGGGKNPLRTILTLAVMAAAFAFAGPLAGALSSSLGLGLTATGTGMALLTGAISGAIGLVGSLAINALAPPPKARIDSRGASVRDDPVYGIAGAANRLRPYEPMPVILGRRRHVCDFAAQPYREMIGDDIYYRMLFVVGLGRYDVSAHQFGDTALTAYEGVEIDVRQPGDPAHTLFPGSAAETSVGTQLKAGVAVERAAPAGADELAVEIEFPRGLVEYNDRGDRVERIVSIEVAYRASGGNWTVVETRTVTASRANAVRVTVTWPVARGDYTVRLTRITGDSTSDRVADESWWNILRRFRNEAPLSDTVMTNATTIALRVKASGQLQGQLPAFSVLVTSILPDYDHATGQWIDRATTNPASLYRHVLQAPFGRVPVGDDRLDLSSLIEFHDWCRIQGWSYSSVVGGQTERELLDDIASAGRAAFAMPSGRYGVLIDRPRAASVHLLTPRNSWGFSSVKTFRRDLHALRVSFVSEAAGWRRDQITVYADGYDATNATVFEALDLGDGITDADLAWRHGRYHLACLILRPETYTVYQDVEHIVVARGDPVDVAHDVLVVGLAQARIKAVIIVGELATGVDLDDTVEMVEGQDYGLSIRLGRGRPNRLAAVVTAPGETSVLTFVDPIPADLLRRDLLVAFGRLGRETLACVVKAIEPGPDLSAKLTLVDMAPAVHTADGEAIPDYDPGISFADVVAPSQPRGSESLYWSAGTRRTKLTWLWRPTASALRHRLRIAGADGLWRQALESAAGRLEILDAEEGEHRIEVIAEGADGRLSVPASASYMVEGEGLAPGAPAALAAIGGHREIVVTCTAPADRDVASITLISASVDDWTVALPVATTPATPLARVTLRQGNLRGLVTHYLWAYAVDAGGNRGPLNSTLGTVATTEQLSHDDLANQVVERSTLVPDLLETIELIDTTDLFNEVDGVRVPTVPTITGGLIGQINTLVPDFQSARIRLTKVETTATDVADRLESVKVEVRHQLGEALLSLHASQQETSSLLRDAGIRTDPATGKVVLYALESYRGENDARVNNVTVTLDAIKASVLTKASVTYVDNVLAAAVLGEADLALFQGVTLRLTTAETAIDGLTATVSFKASQTSVDAQATRLTSAETTIDGLSAALQLAATKVELNGESERLTTAETAIDALAGKISNEVVAIERLAVTQTAGDERTLAALVASAEGDQAARTSVARARTDLTAAIVDGLAAEAASRLELSGTVGDVQAALVAESQIRVTAIAAVASDVETIQVELGSALTQITNERRSRIDGDTATAQETRSLIAVASDTSAELTLLALVAEAEGGERVRANLAYAREELTTAIAEGVSAAATASLQLTARIDDVDAEIADVRTATANALTAEATAREAVAARVATAEETIGDHGTRLTTNEAAIESERSARADALTAEATARELVAATVATRNRTYRQPTAPAAGLDGDIWYDADDGNRSYRWEAGGWVETSDTRIAGTEAGLQDERQARADAVSAEATARELVAARVTTAEGTIGDHGTRLTTNESAIETVRRTSADALGAQASESKSLVAVAQRRADEGDVGQQLETIAQERGIALLKQDLLTRVIEGELAEAHQRGLLGAKIAEAAAALLSEAETRVTTTSALARRIDEAAVRLDSTTVAVATERQARIDEDRAIGERIDQVQVVADNGTAAVQQVATAVSNLTDQLSAKYEVKVQTVAGGRKVFAGIGVSADATLGSEVAVLADRFLVVNLDGSEVRAPFVVSGGKVSIADGFIELLTAVKLRSTDDKFVLDFDGKSLSMTV